MNKILEKKIVNALLLFANYKIDYFTFGRAAKWDDLIADTMRGLIEEYARHIRNQRDMSEAVLMAFAQKIIGLKDRFAPLVKIVGYIKRRRFNFEMIEKRGTYRKWHVTVSKDKDGEYIVVLPDIFTTIKCTRSEILSINIIHNKL